eukprot:tig00021015_g17157.t1
MPTAASLDYGDSYGLPAIKELYPRDVTRDSAILVIHFRYNGGVSIDSVAASCSPMAGSTAWSGTAAVFTGAGLGNVIATGLAANTTYVCTATATNALGTSAPASMNFTTKSTKRLLLFCRE